MASAAGMTGKDAVYDTEEIVPPRLLYGGPLLLDVLDLRHADRRRAQRHRGAVLRHDRLDSNLVTSVNTVGGFLSVAMTFLIGRWVITKGVRGITAFSCVGTAVGLCVLGNGTGLGIYILWSVVSQGLYNGYSFTATNALIANWFPRKKGWVMGITTAGMMGGLFYLGPVYHGVQPPNRGLPTSVISWRP